MKYILSIFFVCLFAVAQAQMKQGVITYTMTYSSDDPEMQMAFGMMENSTMTTYFMPNLSKVEINMGIMMQLETVVNSKKNKALMLMSGMGMNYAIQGKATEFAELNSKSEVTKQVTLMDEAKQIMGYNCKKAIINSSDGKMVEVWYTDEISAKVEGQQYYDTQIPGFSMEVNTSANGINISIAVSGISEEVSKNDFKMSIPEGYEKKTLKDLENMGMQ